MEGEKNSGNSDKSSTEESNINTKDGKSTAAADEDEDCQTSHKEEKEEEKQKEKEKEIREEIDDKGTQSASSDPEHVPPTGKSEENQVEGSKVDKQDKTEEDKKQEKQEEQVEQNEQETSKEEAQPPEDMEESQWPNNSPPEDSKQSPTRPERIDNSSKKTGQESEEQSNREDNHDSTNNSNSNNNSSNSNNNSASSTRSPDPKPSSEDGSSKKVVITEEMCRAIIDSIPSEPISDCTEKVLDAARLCQQTSRHIEVLFNDGSQPWHLVKTLSTRCIVMADKVSDLSGLVGKQAAHVPDKLLPMLSFMSDIASDLNPSTAQEVLQRAQMLISMTTELASLGKDVLAKITDLSAKIIEFRRALFWMGSNSELTYSNTGAAMLWSGELGKLALACAESLSSAALRIADARQSATSFIQALQTAGAWEEEEEDDEEDEDEDEDEEQAKRDAEEESDSDEKEKEDGDKKGGDNSDSDKEGREPETITSRLRRHRMFKQLNREVVNMQTELRELVTHQPSHLDPVSERQKASLFALAMEVASNVHKSVLNSWREYRFSSDVEDEALHSKILDDFSVVAAAGAWHQIAVPSIDARLLRMAALVDSQLLHSLLLEDLVEKALLLMGGRTKATRLAASLDKILDDLAGFDRQPV